MRNIECEERVMLTFEQYSKLIGVYMMEDPSFRYIKIENIYLDDKDISIKRSHKMLRIRHADGKEELTLKIKGNDGDIEINETLDNHPEIDKALDYPFDHYQPITKLKTKRLEAKVDDYLVVIDMNEYSGIIDYDLEIEAPSMDRAKQIIMQICRKYHIEYKENYHSKSSRAISAYLKNKC